jgi:hypothetical protein
MKVNAFPTGPYFATGINVEIPDDVDLNTPEGYQFLKEEVAKRFIAILRAGKFDVGVEYRES